MRIALVALIAILGSGLALAAQTPKAFDVASVKPIAPVSFACNDAGVEYPPGGGFRIKALLPSPVGGMPLGCLIAHAYDVTNLEVVGGPGWLWTDFFAIDARAGGPATRSDIKEMLRTLLSERFGLVVRDDPRFKVKKWVLKMARTDGQLGPGIRRADAECIKTPQNVPVSQRQMRPGQPVPCGMAGDGHFRAGGGQPLSSVIFYIRLGIDDEVIDRTGLTGLFDFYANIPGRSPSGQPDPDAVSIFTAVQEELGMKLEHEEVTRPAVIIERVSRPTPD